MEQFGAGFHFTVSPRFTWFVAGVNEGCGLWQE